MSADFTPAPWRISESDKGFLSIRTGERNSAPDADLLADVYDEADARLMVNAPELYELALQYADDLLFPPSDDSRDRRLARVKAVLAKVGGEQ